MPDQWVAINCYESVFEANLVKGKLESENIDCYLIDEQTITIDWALSNAIGGIKLKVQQADFEKAKTILQELVNIAKLDPKKCPECESTDLVFEKYSRILAFLSILSLGFPFPFLKRTWTCQECEHIWRDQ